MFVKFVFVLLRNQTADVQMNYWELNQYKKSKKKKEVFISFVEISKE